MWMKAYNVQADTDLPRDGKAGRQWETEMKKLQGLAELCEKTAIRFIMVLFALIILYLLFLSMFSTGDISFEANYTGEYTYFIEDSPFLHFAVLFSATAVNVLLLRHKDALLEFRKRISLKKVHSGILFLVLTVLILAANVRPAADQLKVCQTALAMVKGDFAAFDPGGYLSVYPHQMGLVLLLYPLSILFGCGNYLAFRFLNIASMIAVFYVMSLIYRILFRSEILSDFAHCFFGCFFPLTLYVSWVYGTVPGLALSLTGFYFGLRFVSENKAPQMLIAAVSLAVAVQLKKNYLIMLIAYGVMLLLDLIRRRRAMTLAAIAATALLYILSGRGVAYCAEKMTGVEPGRGVPSVGWIAMGLHENDLRANGWYDNSTVNLFQANQYDYDKTKEMQVEDIRKRIEDFRADPGEALEFFVEKIASQWNNPTFQCLWIYNVSRPRVLDRAALIVSNLLQTLILFGTVWYLVFYWKEMELSHVLLPVCFIGGFLFHIFWEAKAQYTMPYFALLLPLSMAGLAAYAKDIWSAVLQKRWKSRALFATAVLAALALLIAWLPTEMTAVLFRLSKDAWLY